MNNYQNLNVSELTELVKKHNHLYWDLNSPEISDYDYDILTQTLRKVDPKAEILNHLGPTFSEIGVEVKHNHPMLSLDKCYDEESLLKWTAKNPLKSTWIMMPKIDGMACSLIYKNGLLNRAATRGTGEIGEDITLNVVNIVPKQISFDGEIEIRGELYMPISEFNKQSDVFANARNAVAGIIKRKEDRTDCGIKFLAYDLIGSDKDTMVEKLETLSLEGFNIPYWRHFKDTFFMQTEYDNVLEKRHLFDYEMDGIVFRIDEDEKYFEMGFTSHHPKGAIAYKFQGDYGETYLRNVHWRISRTGCLNPIAIVDSVKLSGANVTKITLHHAGMIKTRNITINAKVLTVRRGGVIPHLEKVLIPGDTPVLLPDTCPQCGNTTRLEGDFLYCNSNGECSLAHRIMHFISSMEIEGIGLTWIEKLIDEGLLNSIPDLYRLQRQDLMRLENVSDIRADQWLSQISRSRNIELSKFLTSLGIDQLGKKASEVLEENFKSLEKIRNLTIPEIDDINGFGEITAQSIINGLNKNDSLINELLTFIQLKNTEIIQSTGKLNGISFLFTGTLSIMKRAEAESKVISLGGNIASGVSKSLNYLVVGSQGKAGSKLDKAKSLNINIIDENQFIQMVN